MCKINDNFSLFLLVTVTRLQKRKLSSVPATWHIKDCFVAIEKHLPTEVHRILSIRRPARITVRRATAAVEQSEEVDLKNAEHHAAVQNAVAAPEHIDTRRATAAVECNNEEDMVLLWSDASTSLDEKFDPMDNDEYVVGEIELNDAENRMQPTGNSIQDAGIDNAAAIHGNIANNAEIAHDFENNHGNVREIPDLIPIRGAPKLTLSEFVNRQIEILQNTVSRRKRVLQNISNQII